MQLSASHLDDFRVPVQRTVVEIHTAHERSTAVIFLPPQRSLEDFFEETAPFFPAECEGTIRLYARSSVISLVVDEVHATPESLAALGVVHPERSIMVHLRDGSVLTGSLMSLCGAPRTVDFVNQRAKSFALHTGFRVHHVAKTHVERMEEVR